MKILLSGSSGTIGASLRPALEGEGHQLHSLVRQSSPSPGHIPWDPSRPIPPRLLEGFDAVVHLAGESLVGRWTPEKKARILDSRVAGTRHLCQALAQCSQRPRVLISASATGYYGDRGEELLREESPPGRGFLAQVCSEWERAAAAASGAGIRVVPIRMGLVLSPRGGALSQMLLPFRLGLGGKIGSGRQWWSWIDSRDLVAAVLHILHRDGFEGPLNLVSPEPARNVAFTQLLAAALSRPAVFAMPAWVARLSLGEMADEALLASQRVEPAGLLRGGYRFQHPDLKRSLEQILQK